MGSLLAILGWGIAVVGSIWFLVAVFKNSVIGGVLCLLTGIASLVCLFLYWRDTKAPFFVQLAGGAIAFLGAMIARS